MHRTPRREVVLLGSLFALVGASILLGLCYVPRLLVDDAGSRVVVVRAAWLPSRLLAAALGLTTLTMAVGVLAMSVHVAWLVLHPRRMEEREWRSLVWYRLWLRPAACFPGEERYLEALLEDVARTGSTAIAAGLLAALSYLLGSFDQIELDHVSWRYRRTTSYLGLIDVRARERPASDVRGVTHERSVLADDEDPSWFDHHVVVHLADGDADRLSGTEAECRAAEDALQRLLARPPSLELEPSLPR